MTQTLLAKDRFNHAIQCVAPSVVQNISFTNTGSTSTGNDLNANTVVVRLMSTVDCYVSIGLAASVSATTGSMYLPSMSPEYFRVTGLGFRVAARGVSGVGTLNVTEMT